MKTPLSFAGRCPCNVSCSLTPPNTIAYLPTPHNHGIESFPYLFFHHAVTFMLFVSAAPQEGHSLLETLADVCNTSPSLWARLWTPSPSNPELKISILQPWNLKIQIARCLHMTGFQINPEKVSLFLLIWTSFLGIRAASGRGLFFMFFNKK